MYVDILNNKGKPDRVILFNSLAEFCEPKEDNEKCMKIWENDVMSAFSGDPKGWFDTTSKKEFMEILHKGHQRYVDMLLNLHIESKAPRRLRGRPIRGDWGDEVDIHAVNGGNISTAWRRRGKKLRIATPNIRLIAHISMLSSVQAKQAVWRGVATLSIARALEEAGYRVAIDVVGGADDVSDKEHIVTLAPIKIYEEPLDIQSLSSVVTFPGFYRGPGFMNKGLAKGEISYGLGSSKSDHNMRKILDRYYTEPTERLELISKDILSKEMAEEEVKRILASIDSQESIKIAA